MSGALVLNATYEPLCIVTQRRALNLILQAKAELITPTERQFRSATASFAVPSVVRLIAYVKVPYTTRVALNRRAVFARDNYRCQYCHAAAENIDHVIPRSRGGTHTWDNVVAACRACNARKEDRMLHEINMRLRRPPTTPHDRAWVLAATGRRRPDWEQWLRTPSRTPAAMASA
jgi:5-methylcytosine-specific restriction endonuclease McrA